MATKTLLRRIEAAVGNAPLDVAALAEAALSQNDTAQLRLLLAGMRLRQDEVRAAQLEGIRKAQGRKKAYKGRTPAAFSLTKKQENLLHDVLTSEHGTFSIAQAARELGISRTTIYKYMKAAPAVALSIKLRQQAVRRGYRKDHEGSEKKKAASVRAFQGGMKEKGLLRHDRPILDDVRRLREAKKHLSNEREDAARQVDREGMERVLVAMAAQLPTPPDGQRRRIPLRPPVKK